MALFKKNKKQTLKADTSRERRFWTPEFVLVVVMLVVLTVLVWVILTTGTNLGSGSASATPEEIFDYRSNLLSLVLAAFGAWVGAGAAYFFGRESLREAASSLLAMREDSPQERLRQVSIREILPRPVDWTVQDATPLDQVITKLKQDPERWFVPVVSTTGELDTVLNEEAVWRYVHDQLAGGTPPAQVSALLISALRTWLKGQPGLDRLGQEYITVTLDTNALDANDEMERKDVKLAVVTDGKGKPTHFITTGDVRRVLLAPD